MADKPLTDKMHMGDQGIKIGLHCARCNEKVYSGEAHMCAKTETNQNKGAESETN